MYSYNLTVQITFNEWNIKRKYPIFKAIIQIYILLIDILRIQIHLIFQIKISKYAYSL